MILDLQTTFAGIVAVDGTKTAQGPITATQISGNVIDLRNSSLATLVDEGIHGDGDIWLEVKVAQAFNNLTSLTITLESDTVVTLTNLPVVHATVTLALAALTANTTVARMLLPSGDYKRFLGLRFTVTGTAPTTGTLLANIELDTQRNKTYAAGFTIDV